MNLAPIHNGPTALESAGEAYSKSFTRALDGGAPALARASLREVNANLIAIERALTLDEGVPGRPWYRHQICAPGFFTGYDVKTLPSVRESLEQKQWKLTEEQASRLERVLQSAGEKIRSAAAQLDRAVL